MYCYLISQLDPLLQPNFEHLWQIVSSFLVKLLIHPILNLNYLSLCRSRDEIAMWKEKQAQVIKEELRVKETIAKMAAESKSSSKTMKLPTTATTSVSEVRLSLVISEKNLAC